ncbi:MAG: hypothetical protein RRA63_01015 [Candidatus Calescibacterium sp.]|jgi:tRNA nucleotidyltransferase (CCA-adding enzyme)|nr:hypothetical protein [Candidatus Calescibacterium sp.]
MKKYQSSFLAISFIGCLGIFIMHDIEKYDFVIKPVLEEKGEIRVCAVGGFVRDIILKKPVSDFDFVVEGNPEPLAMKLFGRLMGKNLKKYEKFGTIGFEFFGGVIDFARAREEFYPVPGKHPKVFFVDNIERDLKRRDFTINAMAMEIDPSKDYKVIDLFGGIEDIKKRKIRVLHRKSISDDPTRILRAARLKVVLDFEIAEETLESLELAKEIGAFKNVEGDRFWSEIKIASKTPKFSDFILELDRLSVLFSINPALSLGEKEKSKLKELDKLEDNDLKLAKFLLIYYERSPELGYEIARFFKVSKKIEKLMVNMQN